MNCYQHHSEPAVAQCPDCSRGLCPECTTIYLIPICPACNRKRIDTEYGQIIMELLLTFGVGISLAVLFVKQINGGHSFPLMHNIISYVIFGYIFSGIVPGWRTLTRITPAIFLILPIIGWLVYFVFKLALSVCIGLIMLPVRAVRNICRIVTLRKIRV